MRRSTKVDLDKIARDAMLKDLLAAYVEQDKKFGASDSAWPVKVYLPRHGEFLVYLDGGIKQNGRLVADLRKAFDERFTRNPDDENTFTAGNRTVRVNPRKNQFGEYVVRLYVDGKLYRDADYFTDDLKDARATAKLMVKAPNVNPSKKRKARKAGVRVNPKKRKSRQFDATPRVRESIDYGVVSGKKQPYICVEVQRGNEWRTLAKMKDTTEMRILAKRFARTYQRAHRSEKLRVIAHSTNFQ